MLSCLLSYSLFSLFKHHVILYYQCSVYGFELATQILISQFCIMTEITQPSCSLSTPLPIFSLAPHTYDKYEKKSLKETTYVRKANPYFLFCKERRTQLHTERPGTPSREITKILAEEWKQMNECERSKYFEKYKHSLLNQQEEKQRGLSDNQSLTEQADENKANPIVGHYTFQFKMLNGQTFSIPAIISKNPSFK